MVETVIFDLDGTLLDTLGDLCDSVNFILSAHGYPNRSLSEVRMFVGNGVRRLLERALPDGCAKDEADACFAEFCEYYGMHSEIKTKPYDGVTDMLKSLHDKGISVAVVSNKVDFATRSLCEKYFGGLVLAAVGDREGVPKKPEPDLVNIALNMLGARDRSRAVYVGDSDVDILTAKNTGLGCISVTWGFRSREFLEECGGNIFAADPRELLEIIENL